MSRPHTYREVDIPRNFDQWGEQAQINFLCTAMDREQIANTVRELHDLDTRDKPLFRKDELAEIVVQKVNGDE